MTDFNEQNTRTTGDNPTSPKLPPPNASSQTDPPEKDTGSGFQIPTEGVSAKLKTFVIGLTVVTFVAFGIFTAMLFKKSMSSEEKAAAQAPSNSTLWNTQALAVAEKLRDSGLYEQAVTQYEAYLENPNLNLETRSNVAYIMGGLYMELGNCGEALVWFFHSEAAVKDAPWSIDRNKRIDGCLHQLKANP
ncbi:hypothetical protein NITGR_780021 [Nitrospina gracilis 3/211]|uniref:Tetratricopeptide repeat-like domain-containing protein n=1 Tax=Nitrospina gracilis (strain 3/211) TaxID=1266370 RepID=M1ZDY8_NITG3|nr:MULTISPECIES: hypothetical protein [Nitrospina]MCF8724548.1 hypothetical protein [Nitrospina sp. Nb-3]CCQ91717.1 hypothetical protein NITGR_780021 [Nitrospina gracilis 3/211]